MRERSRQRFKNLENENSFQDEISFFINLKGLLLTQIKQVFLEGESPTLIRVYVQFHQNQ